jgi:Na+-driven multidrug efflux pump
LIVCSLCVGVNALLNFVLIHGVGEFGGWGFKGSPIATAVSSWLMLLLLWLYVAVTGVHKRTCVLGSWGADTFTADRVCMSQAYALAPMHWRPSTCDLLCLCPGAVAWLLRQLHEFVFKQCVPRAVGITLEEVQLEVVAFFAASLGTVEIATHNAVLNVFFVMTSAMYGLTKATR